jgi:methylmalonyl-CoA mutase N-terminal domain/subunit
MEQAIETGFVQKEIQESAYRYQRQVEEKKQIIVSLNEFTNTNENILFTLHSPQEEGEKDQLARLKHVKTYRSEIQVKQHLHSLELAAREGQNVFPPILDAVRDLATLEEISSVLRKVYGTYQENINI